MPENGRRDLIRRLKVNSTQNLQIHCKIYSPVALFVGTSGCNPMIVAACDWAGDEKSNGITRLAVTSTTTGLIWEFAFAMGFSIMQLSRQMALQEPLFMT